MNALLTSFTAIFATDVVTKACLSAICLILVSLFGDNWILYISLIVLVSFDTFTGYLVGRYNGNVSSRNFFKGWSKIMVFTIMLLAFHLLVRFEPALAKIDWPVAAWIAVNETLSIIENASKMGLPIPSFLTKGLEVLKNKKP